MTLRRLPVVAALAIGAALICQQPGETAQASLPSALLGVPLNPEYRDADTALAKQLGRALQIELKHDDKFNTYGDLIERVTTTTDRYVARMTPYAFVAAEMLGARLEVLGTYESVATGTTTYQSYFVVNKQKFGELPATVDGILAYLEKLKKPARFVYHDKFSTSSYLLPALWFRSHRIFATEQRENSVLRVETPSSSSSESVEKVAADQADLAAVWDGTRSKFETNAAVLFVPFLFRLPNDLLVASMSLDESTKAKIRDAIDGTSEIAIGDFKRWRSIDHAREALDALNRLKRVAKMPPAPVVVRVKPDQADQSEEVAGRLLTVADAARQAIRLAGTEFVLEDPKFHSAADVVWTVKWVHDGAIRLASEMQVSKPDISERLKQEFHVSFTPTEGDLTTRIVSLIHSRMHRVRYLWPYQERTPTVIRDVDFAIPRGEKVHVQRLTWRDPDRNEYVLVETFDTVPVEISAATFAFNKSDFVRTATGTVDFQNPMSDVAYKVVLERRSHESTFSKVLAGSFIALFLLTGAGAAFDLRRRLLPRPAQPPRTFPQICRDMAARLHRVWNADSLTDADVLFCNRPRVEEQIEELKARGLVPASMGGITRLARGVTAGVAVPFVKAILSGEISRSVELVIDQAKVGDTMRLGALLDLMIRKELMSGFVGRPLAWDALNEAVRTNLPGAEGGDLLIRPEDETVVKIASRHFGQVLNDGMKHLSLLRGTWSVSKQDGRWVAQQRIELQGPLQVRGACLTTMLIEFNISNEVERVDDGSSSTLECWVLGKIVRHSIVDDAGVPILWLHIRTMALLLDKALSGGVMAPQMLAAEPPGTLTFPVPAAVPVMSPRWGFARGRLAALLLVAVVCAINLGETALEERWSSAMTARGLEFASALHWLEGQAGLENETVRDVVSVYGFSLAYFVLFPAIVVATALALARRPNPQAFRTFAFALVIDYVCSVPFFLFFPVPERWSYPDAGAILLSDLWDSRLIEAFRPMSGLDNCFPSFHTSMTVIVVLCGFIYRVGFRLTMIPLAAMVTMSTYMLGVHWAGDVIAGTALGIISVAAGCRLAERGASAEPTSLLHQA